jgi:hypothetical protein
MWMLEIVRYFNMFEINNPATRSITAISVAA